ncbi:MAG: hypothetical protein H6732_13495 [Alphaproteobacteria bacterium]|nr:hypothetical protein [Alphaproteobacteria bacterium]
MRSLIPMLAVCAGASGCSVWRGAYDMGLLVRGQETQQVTTKGYTFIAGLPLFETQGLFGSGATCDDALKSTGTTTVVQDLMVDRSWEGIGTAWTANMWGVEELGDVAYPINVVYEQSMGMGTTTTDSLNRTIDGDETASRTISPFNEGTRAEYAGYAGIDYIIRQDMVDHWRPVPSSSSEWGEINDSGGEGGFQFGSFGYGDGARVIKKRNPAEGDIWTSFDGAVIYKFAGFEERTIGGRALSTERIDAYRIQDFNASGNALGQGVLDRCVAIKDGEATGADEETGNPLQQPFKQAFFDAGCANGFEHRMVGTMWFYKDILVEWQKSYVEIQPRNTLGQGFGFLFRLDDETGCQLEGRTTDTDPAAGEGAPFVDFLVRTTTSNFKATSLTLDGNEF